jgi:hypothetical protein
MNMKTRQKTPEPLPARDGSVTWYPITFRPRWMPRGRDVRVIVAWRHATHDADIGIESTWWDCVKAGSYDHERDAVWTPVERHCPLYRRRRCSQNKEISDG